MFTQYKEVSKATKPTFVLYRLDSLLALWIADVPCCVWEVPCTFEVSTVIPSITGKKLKCISSLKDTQKGYPQQTSKTTLIKMAPGILNSNTFLSAISNCCICFTSSSLTEAIQANTAPTFPRPFLTKHILQILPPLFSQLFFLYQPLFHTLHFKKRQNFRIYVFHATPLPHDKHMCIDAVTQWLFQDTFLHIIQLQSFIIIKQWS